MDKIIKNKKGLEIVTSRSSGYETCSRNSFISYVLSEQFWWCNVKQFLSYSKNYISKFMQANTWHQILPLPFGLLNLESVERKEKITTYLENKNLDEIKNMFYSFWRAIIWRINKNMIKSGHKLQVYDHDSWSLKLYQAWIYIFHIMCKKYKCEK